MSHYAQNTGRHCMAVLILSATEKRLDTAGISKKSKDGKHVLSLFGLRCNVVVRDSAIFVEGRKMAEWASVGITEAQAKVVMHGSGVLKKCTWEQLWRAYKSQ